MSAAGILQAGGPMGSRSPALGHECTAPGVYACPEGEATPFQYATRARMLHADQGSYNDGFFDSRPMVQLAFRGSDTKAGRETRAIKHMGSDQQYIYAQDDDII